MKKNLLYAALILFGLNGLHAFNPFTAMRNVARGEASCQPALVDKISKGLPAFQANRNKTLTGAALKSRQDFEKDIALLHKCTGDDPRKNHPKLTEKVSSTCSQNPQFRKMFPNQCAIAGKAKNSVDRQKGIQTNSPNARNNNQSTNGGRKARRGSGRNPNNGMQQQYPQQYYPQQQYPQQEYPQQYYPQQQYPQQEYPQQYYPQQYYPQQYYPQQYYPQQQYPQQMMPPVDPMQQYQQYPQMMPPPSAPYPGMMQYPNPYGG